MVSKTMGVLFFLKKPQQYQQGVQPIYLRITVDGKRAELSVKRECEPSKWNGRAGRALGNKEATKSLNAYLDTLQHKVYEAYKALLDQGVNITAGRIKNKLMGIEERPRMILEVFSDHNEQLKSLVGHGYAPLTLKRYKTALEHAREFILWKYKTADMEITRLDYGFITDYEFYLRSVRKCAHNSTMKYLANFKKIVLLCVKRGWLPKDPFYGFKLAVKEVVREVLSAEELDRIASREFAVERLRVARDIFLFSCYTGLAYVDVHRLRRSNIQIGMDGQQWIISSRQKTDTPFRLPLLAVPLLIMERYRDHPLCVNQDRLLPVWSNQKLNEYLKEIADVCGITKKLTYHMARHTFATTITLNNGVPIETVSKMLGHKTIRITQHYAKTLDKKVSEDMQNLRQKLEKGRNGASSQAG
jgi:site-specific recombinase XerD